MTRSAVRWATYPGECTGNVGQLVGPNTLGEVLHIVDEQYDAASNHTRIGFAYGLPSIQSPATATSTGETSPSPQTKPVGQSA